MQIGLQKAITPSITSYVWNTVYDKDLLQTNAFWKDDILEEIKCSRTNSLLKIQLYWNIIDPTLVPFLTELNIFRD